MMLTSDLIRVRVIKKLIEPILIKKTPKYQKFAQQILNVFQDSQSKQLSRAELDLLIKDLCALEVDHKIFRGISKVMLDRCEFEIPVLPISKPLDSQDLRMTIFTRSAKMGIFSNTPVEHRITRQQVLSQICDELNAEQQEVLTPEELMTALYADLKDFHILTKYDGPKVSSDLIDRYNLSMCQALLLRSSSVVVELVKVDIKWLRYLFRYIKFHKLIYEVELIHSEELPTALNEDGLLSNEQQPCDLKIHLDGPQSLFKQSSRYGMQLAIFFPALVALPYSWSLEAVVLWGKKRKLKKTMSLSSDMGLLSHYQPTATWRSAAEQDFERRYNEFYTKQIEKQQSVVSSDGRKDKGSSSSSEHIVLWELKQGRLVPGKGQQVFFPDFCFYHNGRTIYMEIVGFWRSSGLRKKIRQTPKNYFFAISRRLSGEGANKISGKDLKKTIDFAEIISISKVVTKVEEIARDAFT